MTTSPEIVWRDALRDGQLLLQRAQASGSVFFPPRMMEPGTGDADWDWLEAQGLGTVYSVTVVSQRPPAAPYNVVLVDLDEGARLMSRVEGIADEAVSIGLRVRVRIAPDGAEGEPILLFDPV